MARETSQRIDGLINLMAPVNDFFLNSAWAERMGDPEIYGLWATPCTYRKAPSTCW